MESFTGFPPREALGCAPAGFENAHIALTCPHSGGLANQVRTQTGAGNVGRDRAPMSVTQRPESRGGQTHDRAARAAWQQTRLAPTPSRQE
jgi:hypothetical protein